MNRLLVTTVLLAGTLGLVVAASQRTAGDMAAMEFALSWALRLAGGLVALFAAAGLLGLWWASAGVERLAPGVVVLLAGLALGGASWPAVLALGAVAVALVVARRSSLSEPEA